MTDKSNNQGRGFEYQCLNALYLEISKYRSVSIDKNTSYDAAKKAWDLLPPSFQNTMIESAHAFVQTIFDFEPRILDDDGKPVVLLIQKDSKGEEGDVRDIILVRKSIDWEIGFSIKHNHFAVKHSRLSGTIDFGDKWFGLKCSESYWREVRPIFSHLEEEKKKGTRWSEISNKDAEVYIPLLNAFISEINRSYSCHKELPAKMVEYLLGEYDFYKLISMDAKRATQIQAYNFRGTLNNIARTTKPKIIIPKSNLPTRLIKLDLKPGSTTTVELYLNCGWQFSFRIHNASTFVEPSLKFDIQIIGMPTTIFTIKCDW